MTVLITTRSTPSEPQMADFRSFWRQNACVTQLVVPPTASLRFSRSLSLSLSLSLARARADAFHNAPCAASPARPACGVRTASGGSDGGDATRLRQKGYSSHHSSVSSARLNEAVNSPSIFAHVAVATATVYLRSTPGDTLNRPPVQTRAKRMGIRRASSSFTLRISRKKSPPRKGVTPSCS